MMLSLDQLKDLRNESSNLGSSSGRIRTRGKYVNQACEQCRNAKVKCQIEGASQERKCRRCFASDRDCFFASSARRKPRKRTDKRVSELEQKLEEMQNLIANSNPSRSPSVEDDPLTSSFAGKIPTPAFDKSPASSIDPSVSVTTKRSSKNANYPMTSALDDGISNDNSSAGESHSEHVESLEQSVSLEDVVGRGLISARMAETLFDR